MTESREPRPVSPPSEEGTGAPERRDRPKHSARRRRFIITGLATPTIMSLPSRRVWAAKCSKSKLKKSSGLLSANKKKLDDLLACEIACTQDFWKHSVNWPDPTLHGAGLNDCFSIHYFNVFKTLSEPGLLDGVQGLDESACDDTKLGPGGTGKSWEDCKGELKDLFKHACPGFLNAGHLNNMNLIVNYRLTLSKFITQMDPIDLNDPPGTSQLMVAQLVQQCLSDAKDLLVLGKDGDAKSIIKNLKDDFKDTHAMGTCPLTNNN